MLHVVYSLLSDWWHQHLMVKSSLIKTESSVYSLSYSLAFLVYIFMKTFRNGKITYLLTYILLCLSDYRRLFHLLNYRWLYGFLQDSAIV